MAGGLLVAERITPLGAVVAGLSPGRTSAGEITRFDGTGIALQDLAVAAAAASIAAERKLGLQIDL